jgi:hypothetical protein
MQRSRARVKLRAMMRACLVAMIVLCGCNGDSSATDGGTEAASDTKQPPATCTSDSDCPSVGNKRWFPVDGGCGVQQNTGTCISFSPPDKCAPTVACGCDGTSISVCAPAGYVDRPSNYAGACPDDGGADASPE